MTEHRSCLWRAILGFRRTDHPTHEQVYAAAGRLMRARLGFAPGSKPTEREIKAACWRKHLRPSRSVGPATALVWALTELGPGKRKVVA